MDPRIKLVCIVASLALLALVLELVRRDVLREGYSLLWIAAALLLLLVSVFNSLLFGVAKWLRVMDANSLLFAGAFLFVCIMLIHVSVELSRLRRETKELAQAQALTEWRARKALDASGPKDSGAEGSSSCESEV